MIKFHGDHKENEDKKQNSAFECGIIHLEKTESVEQNQKEQTKTLFGRHGIR